MKKRNSILKDILEVIVSVIVLTFILLKFVIMPCQVNGTSMVPTLQDGDFAYSFVCTRNIGINRFDICVVDTESVEKEKLLVKRVIGLPNEKLEYRDNKLYINDEYIVESFLNDKFTEDFVIQLKDDQYFCMGDNREVSKDSRFYGPFSKEDIKATKMFVIYPFSRLGVKK